MKLSDAYPSRYLTAEDLNGQDVVVTIANVELERIGQGKDAQDKLVISFQGKKKTLVCNKTNAKMIEKVLGSDDTDEWIGKRIIIGPREVEFQGDLVTALRVSPKSPTAGGAVPAKAPAKPEPSDNDGGNVDNTDDVGF